MEIKVIDNFLPESEINSINFIIGGVYFPWHYNDFVNYEGDKLFQFTHVFFDLQKGGVNSSYFNILNSCISKLNISKLIRIKANLNTKTFFRTKTGFHCDYKNIKTSILYLNTNNGGTKFKNGKYVKSLSNRMVIFNSNLEHSAVNCNDKNRRLVINFNYI